MAAIKSYTDLEQSKVLAKILPLESADMFYDGYKNVLDNEEINYQIDVVSNWTTAYPNKSLFEKSDDVTIPCWSLAALYGILPNNKKETTTLSRGGWRIEPIEYLDNWWCEYEDDSHAKDFTVSADNPIDACYEMILKLNELNLL